MIVPQEPDSGSTWLRSTAHTDASEAAELLSLLIDSVNDYAIFALDSEGRVKTWNSGATRLTGHSTQEIIGRPFHIFFTPSDIAAGKPEMELSLAKQFGRYEEEGWLVRKDGSLFWASVVITPMLDRYKELRGYSKVVRDMTSKMQADAQKQELHARMQKIASQVPGVIYQFKLKPDGTSCFPYASEGIRKIYRVKPDEVVDSAQKVFDILHPDDFDMVAASIRKSADTMKVWQCEYRVKFPDGTVRWLYGNSKPERTDDGCIVWHGFITDITEQKERDLFLRESQAFQQRVLADSTQGIVSVDMTGTISSFNPQAEQTFGYAAAEVIGKETPAIFHVMEDIVAHAARLSEELGTPIEPGMEVFFAKPRLGLRDDNVWTMVRKDGSRFEARLNVSVVRNEAGDIAGFVGILKSLND